VAKELQIDWSKVKGTGRGGRVRECDVRGAISNGNARTSRRNTIATRLRNSQAETVPVTLTSQADATNLIALRSKLKANGPSPAPSYTEIIAKLVAGELKQHPHIAARWCNGQLKTADEVHIGIAVDTDDGLLVPVIQDVDTLLLTELSRRLRELIDAARAGTLAASDMQDGTFTITNLGAYGIDAFTPVINYPEIAILGLGAIRPIAVVYQNQCVARDMMTLSLTFDHAAIDGAPAATFLQSVCQAIEQLRDWPTAGH
jgi:pyruvate dehydrogenase E2 component (dihydrolipoamide acetyltransferase)